jgi:HlyD family secretion protein
MKKSKIKTWWIVVGIIILIIATIVVTEKVKGKKGEKVATAKTESRTILETVSASGKIQPEIEVAISPDVSGEIMELNVREGDSVIKGQMLARINPDLYNTDLDRTKASLENTKASFESARSRINQADARLTAELSNYNRSKKLHDQKVLSDADWEAVQNLYANAKGELEAAKLNQKALEYTVKGSEAIVNQSQKQLGRTNVYAPMNGIVTKKLKNKGERVVGTSNFAGTDIIKIADLNSMQVIISVNENDIAKISLYDSAEIEVDAYPNRKFKGIVTEIANSANVIGASADQVTNFEVKVNIIRSSYIELVKAGKKYPFRPGMSASVDIHTEKVENITAVPIQAVTIREKAESKTKVKENADNKPEDANSPMNNEPDEVVFVYNAGIVKKVKIRTGIQDDEYIQIIEGLKPGDEVVIAPGLLLNSTLKDGDKVVKVDKNELFIKK